MSKYIEQSSSNYFNSSSISSKLSSIISFYYTSKFHFYKLFNYLTSIIIFLKPIFLIELFDKFKLSYIKLFNFPKCIILQYPISTFSKFLSYKSISTLYPSSSISPNYKLISSYLSYFQQTYKNYINILVI